MSKFFKIPFRVDNPKWHEAYDKMSRFKVLMGLYPDLPYTLDNGEMIEKFFKEYTNGIKNWNVTNNHVYIEYNGATPIDEEFKEWLI